MSKKLLSEELNEEGQMFSKVLTEDTSEKDMYKFMDKYEVESCAKMAEEFNSFNKNGIVRAKADKDFIKIYFDMTDIKDPFIDKDTYSGKSHGNAFIYPDTEKIENFFRSAGQKYLVKKVTYNNGVVLIFDSKKMEGLYKSQSK